VAILADGYLVSMFFVREYPEPSDPSKKYTTTWFDMFRIVDGKIAESLGSRHQVGQARTPSQRFTCLSSFLQPPSSRSAAREVVPWPIVLSPCRNQQHPAVLHALDLAIEHTDLRDCARRSAELIASSFALMRSSPADRL
jgi:hypothetical protein